MTRFASVLVLTVLFGCVVTAEDAPKPKQQATAGGKVKAVDAKGGTITIIQRIDNKEKDLIVRFASNAKIAVDGKVATLDHVPVGAPQARVFGGKLEASQVADAEWLWVVGTSELGIFKKVSNDTLTYKPDGTPANKPPDKTLKLAPDAKPMINGKEGKFTDFKSGDKIFIRYTADGKFALIVSGGKEPK